MAADLHFSEWLDENLLERGRGAARRLAEHVGVSPSQVARWRQGQTPDNERLPLIAEHFGLPSDGLDRMVSNQRRAVRVEHAIAGASDSELADLMSSVDGLREALNSIAAVVPPRNLLAHLQLDPDLLVQLEQQVQGFLASYAGVEKVLDAIDDHPGLQELRAALDATAASLRPQLEALAALGARVTELDFLQGNTLTHDEVEQLMAAEGAKGDPHDVETGPASSRPSPEPEPDGP